MMQKEESKTEMVLAAFMLLFFFYLLFGLPVWLAIAEGKPIYPGLLYEPAVRFIGWLLS